MANKWIDVKVTGVEKILRKMNRVDPVLAGPWTKALRAAAELVRHDMQGLAPGSLGAHVSIRMHARPVPLFAKVGLLPMPKNKGFAYPGALHGGAKFHYRSGPHRGQQTKGWLTKSLERCQSQINDLLGRAANEIKTDWES